MEAPAKWFLRLLKDINPEFYVKIDYQNRVYLICRMKYVPETHADGSVHYIQEERIVDDFEHLNDAAMAHLRYRKWLGTKYRTAEGVERWRLYLKERKTERVRRERLRKADDWAPEIESIYKSDERHTVS